MARSRRSESKEKNQESIGKETEKENEILKTPPQDALANKHNEISGCCDYDKIREERIKENRERMEKLGILSLSHQLKSSASPNPKAAAASKSPNQKRNAATKIQRLIPSRRSSRLQNVAPISYAEIRVKHETEKPPRKNMVVYEGEREEVYTEEHVKLLGTCETTWTLFVDGYGKDGKRIYDQVLGKTCHQCRQKTLGYHTSCSKCDLVQGQFCGDCLYMRYGENVLEVKKNPNWVCPVCRDICNCSICRVKKGWTPTGMLYKKIRQEGFKSVAHYLIETRQSHKKLGADSIQASSANRLALVVADEPSPGQKALECDSDIKSMSYKAINDGNSDDEVEKVPDKADLDMSDENVCLSSITSCEKVTADVDIQVSPDCVASRLRKRVKLP